MNGFKEIGTEIPTGVCACVCVCDSTIYMETQRAEDSQNTHEDDQCGGIC